MEGFILRVRIVFYTTLIVSLTSFPLVCSIFIFFIELTHIGIYLYYSLRYKNLRNWFLIISKLNMGISILTLSFASILIIFTQSDPLSFKNKVPPFIQYACIVIFLASFILEGLLQIFNFILVVIFLIRDCVKNSKN